MTTRLQIPGNFYADVDDNGTVLGYRFLPAAGDAGFFGPAAWDDETGEQIASDSEAAEALWDGVNESLEFKGDEATIAVPVTWEG